MGNSPPSGRHEGRAAIALGFVVAIVLTLWAPRLPAQTPKTTKNATDLPAQERPIRVESKLVLIPTFVYVKYGLEREVTLDEDRCMTYESSRFVTLSAEEPYLPTKCLPGREVEDLTLDDFRLLEDGEPQTIRTLEKATSPLLVRDSRSWHVETSIAPRALWSTTDLAHPFLPHSPYSFRISDPSTYYVVGYVPTRSTEGCHQIRVEVRRPKAAEVFARDEYCAGQTPSDLLNGTKAGQELELDLSKDERAKLPLFVQAGAFRGAGNRQLVDVVLEFPWNQLDHYWEARTGKLEASIGVLGTIYSRDGRPVARFSDLLWPAYWPSIVGGAATQYALGALDGGGVSLDHWDPAWLPTRYETEFDLPAGEYELRVAVSDGKKFGRATVPLTIENYDPKSLGLGSVFLCNRFRDAHVAAAETAAANFAPQYVPLVSKGVRVTPAGDTRFSPDTQLSAYFEIYEPPNAAEPTPQIHAHVRIVAEKDGAIVKDFPPVDAAPYMQPRSATIPIAREIPIATLRKGEYRLEVQATDSTGRSTAGRSASFTISDKK